MAIENFLRKISIFSELDNKELQEISGLVQERFYKKGTIVIAEGDIADSIFIVKEGKVKIYKTTKDGRQVILDIKDDGSIIGEVTLFSSKSYPASVKVIEDSTIYNIKNKDLEFIIKKNPTLALAIIKILNKRLFNAQQKIKNMALNDTFVRTATILIGLGEKYGEKTKQGIEIKLNITREELANLVGTSRETISRILSKFSKEKSIKTTGRSIIIINKKKLKSWRF